MKSFAIIFAVVSVLLAAALVFTKHGDGAALDAANGSVADFSNRLDSAQVLFTEQAKSLFSLSNELTSCSAAAETFSNNLTAAQSAWAAESDQVTNLTRQVASTAAENAALGADLLAATNQLTALMAQLAGTEAGLARTNQDLADLRKDYGLLQNRFQRDVAERLVVERKFNNPEALQAQLAKLKEYGGSFDVTTEKIYSGLDVEVRSNGVAHVTAPE